jgi:hypothetical protein
MIRGSVVPVLVFSLVLVPCDLGAQERGAPRFEAAERAAPSVPAALDAAPPVGVGLSGAGAGMALGTLAGGLAGVGLWALLDHGYGSDCWFCGAEVAGYAVLGSLFGAVAGGIVGDVIGDRARERRR